MNDIGKPISPEELKKMEEQVKRVNDFRGETAACCTEVEALLDEVIIKFFIVPEEQEKFYDVFLWPSFSMPAKIRLLKLIDPKFVGGKEKAEKLVKDIQYLYTTRNHVVHGLILISEPNKPPLLAGRKTVQVDEEMIRSFRDTYKEVMALLQAILISWFVASKQKAI